MAILEHIKRLKREDFVNISHYLKEQLVCFLDVDTQPQAISQLVDCLDEAGVLSDKEVFHSAILQREKIVSTGIGLGVAIPHAKLAGYRDFFIAIGIQKNRGIEWQALDGAPVRIIFMIGGPENRQTEYLKILSLLTSAVKEEERRKKLLKATSRSEVIKIFEGL